MATKYTEIFMQRSICFVLQYPGLIFHLFLLLSSGFIYFNIFCVVTGKLGMLITKVDCMIGILSEIHTYLLLVTHTTNVV